MYTIAKDFSFCFGHRVWSQTLNADFANDLQCACRHLHGHEAKVVIHLSAETLTDGMVTDFRHLEWFKKFVDTYLDHKFVLDRNDPLFSQLTLCYSTIPVTFENKVVGSTVDASMLTRHDREYIESFFVVEFVPTSENFSKWLYDIVQSKMSKLGVTVDAIEWWESPKSRSVYSKTQS